jgi:hypothetical protein
MNFPPTPIYIIYRIYIPFLYILYTTPFHLSVVQSPLVSVSFKKTHFDKIEPEPEFVNGKEPKDRFQIIDYASLCSLADRYANMVVVPARESISGLIKRFKNSGSVVERVSTPPPASPPSLYHS